MDVCPLPPGLPAAFSPPRMPWLNTRLGKGEACPIQARARFLQLTALRDAAHLASVAALNSIFPKNGFSRITSDMSFLVGPGEVAPTEAHMAPFLSNTATKHAGRLVTQPTICTALPDALNIAIRLQGERTDQIARGCTFVLPDTSGAIPAWLYLPSFPHEFPELTLETQHGTYLLVFSDQIEVFLTQTPTRPNNAIGNKLSLMPSHALCHKLRLSHLNRIAQATTDLAPRIKEQLLVNGVGPGHSETMAKWMQNFIVHALATTAHDDCKAITNGLDYVMSVLKKVLGPTQSLDSSPFETKPSPRFEAMAERWAFVDEQLQTSAYGAAQDIPRSEPDRALVNLNCALSLAIDRVGL